MASNTDAWLKRAKAILAEGMGGMHEGEGFAPSILAALYGPRSAQLDAFNKRMEEISRSMKEGARHHQQQHAYSTIRNVVGEIENGLVVNVRAQVAGEVLAELVSLGKEFLGNTDSAKNVSAVLIAAAFEDLMRRMGSEMAGVAGRPKLDEVLTALKNAGVLKGGEVGVAQSYLKFRNDSLHADWPNVQKSQVESCTAFIESLLMKHFSS